MHPFACRVAAFCGCATHSCFAATWVPAILDAPFSVCAHGWFSRRDREVFEGKGSVSHHHDLSGGDDDSSTRNGTGNEHSGSAGLSAEAVHALPRSILPSPVCAYAPMTSLPLRAHRDSEFYVALRFSRLS